MFLKNKSYFLKSALKLLYGGVIAQIIPYIGMFVLARLYLPEDFGDFALFTSISTIIAVAAAGRYEFAIQLPKTYQDAVSVLYLALLVQFCCSMVVFFIILFLQKIKFLALNVSYFWYFLPFSIISIASFQVFIQWLFRYGVYSKINLARFIQTLSTVFLSIVFYYFYPRYGLIISFVFGWLFGLIGLVFFAFKFTDLNKKPSLFDIKRVALHYRDHLFYGALPSILDATTNFLLIFIIEQHYGKFYTGEYTMSLKIAYAPISLIVSVIGQLLFKQSSQLIQNNKSDYDLFKKALYFLIFAATLYVFINILCSSIFFETFIGEHWAVAGEMTKILALSYGIKLIVSPLSVFLLSHNKIKLNGLWQTLYFCGIASLNFYIPTNPLDFCRGLLCIDVLFYSLYYFMIYKFNFLKKQKNIMYRNEMNT